MSSQKALSISTLQASRLTTSDFKHLHQSTPSQAGITRALMSPSSREFNLKGYLPCHTLHLLSCTSLPIHYPLTNSARTSEPIWSSFQYIHISKNLDKALHHVRLEEKPSLRHLRGVWLRAIASHWGGFQTSSIFGPWRAPGKMNGLFLTAGSFL